MKKRWIIVISVLVVFAVLGLLFRNDILLNRYAKQLYSIPLPPETELISQDQALGNLYGTGDHMDFAVQMVVRSSLSVEELQAYYDEFQPKTVEELSLLPMGDIMDMAIDHTGQVIEVIPKEEAVLFTGSKFVYTRRAQDGQEAASGEFIIQMKDTHYPAGLDIRGC